MKRALAYCRDCLGMTFYLAGARKNPFAKDNGSKDTIHLIIKEKVGQFVR